MTYIELVIQSVVKEYQPSCGSCQGELYEESLSLQRLKSLSSRAFVFDAFCLTCGQKSGFTLDLGMRNLPTGIGLIDFSFNRLSEQDVLKEAVEHLKNPAG